jgi:hypothetical protein
MGFKSCPSKARSHSFAVYLIDVLGILYRYVHVARCEEDDGFGEVGA